MIRKFVLVLGALAFLFAAVVCDQDSYADQRPAHYPNSTWVCEAYDMRFEVDENGITTGSMVINGEETSFSCRYNAFDGRGIDFVTDDYYVAKSDDGQYVTVGYLFGGTTKLIKDRCEITITSDSIKLFSELPTILVFERTS